MVNSPQQIKNKIRKRVMKMVINDSNILNKWAMLSSLLNDKRLHDVDVVKWYQETLDEMIDDGILMYYDNDDEFERITLICPIARL